MDGRIGVPIFCKGKRCEFFDRCRCRAITHWRCVGGDHAVVGLPGKVMCERFGARLTDTGLAFDRHWMVVDAEGAFLTQRELPRMALIQPVLKRDALALNAPGMLALQIAFGVVQDAVTVNIWGDSAAAFDTGDAAARWLSDFLGTSARRVCFNPGHWRYSDRSWTAGVDAVNQHSDGFLLRVISQPSLDDFNARLATRGEAPVSTMRFRPNMVLGNLPATVDTPALFAYDEDRPDALHIDTETDIAVLQRVRPCPRCPIPNLNSATGVSTPLVGDLLKSHRSDARLGGAVTFGMNAIIAPRRGGERAGAASPMLRVGQWVSGNYRV